MWGARTFWCAGSVANFDFGAISENRISKNQWVMAAKKLMNENL
jgi:hypothetical protein